MSEWKAFAAGESEYRFRQLMTYLFAQAGTGLAVTGVLPAPSGARLQVIQTTTASTSILVNRGAAVWQGTNSDGVHPLVNDTTKTIDVLGPSPMGSVPRNDLVIFNADTAAIEVVPGVPNAIPTDPPVSANHIKLARIRNAANATTIPTSAIDDLRTFTTLNTALTDTGWVDVAIASGKTGQNGQPPQVRREGKRTSIRWGWTNTQITTPGAEIIVGTVPQYGPDGVTPLRPPRTAYLEVLGSTGNQRAMALVNTAGVISIRVPSGALDYYLFSGELNGWYMD